MTPEWTTAIATCVIAAFTIVSAWALIRTLSHNRRLVLAAARQAEIQWQAAVPRLRPGLLAPFDNDPLGRQLLQIDYIAGTLPARGVEVWLAQRGFLYHGSLDTITASDANANCVLDRLAAMPGATSPFPDMTNPTGPNEWWVGLIWADPMRQRYRTSSERTFGAYRLLSQEAVGERNFSEMQIRVSWGSEPEPARCQRCWFWAPVVARVSRSDRIGSIPVCHRHADAVGKNERRMMRFVMDRLG